MPTSPHGRIRVGVGGWVYEPWRNNFYPPGLAHAKELAYLSERVTTIEINATFYRNQSAASFAKWRDATPDDFVFSVKATRYATNRRVLAEAGETIERFLASGLAELGPKLGPIVWQFAPHKAFEADDFGAFLQLLPDRLGTLRLRHAIEVRHPSFMCSEYLAIARRHRAATVFADSDEHPSFADVTGDFVYARLMRGDSACETGYRADAIAVMGRVRAGLGRGPGAGGARPRRSAIFGSAPRATSSCSSSAAPRSVLLQPRSRRSLLSPPPDRVSKRKGLARAGAGKASVNGDACR